MEEQISVITRKNQITVPARFLRALGLRQGDKVAVVLDEDDQGGLRIRPVHSVVDAAYGVFHRPGAALDLDQARHQFGESAGREGGPRSPDQR